ncbi:MAG: hypothetical protein U1F52_03070 [Burkholderiales bacterium]
MKLNLGCGHRKREGYVNVDMFEACSPDVLWDLEQFPWPWPDASADEVLFHHSLEHLGQSTPVFLGLMRELYRICRDGAEVQINVPHPRHDFFIGDPTHVRAITPQSLSLFDRALNDEWQRTGSSAATPLAHYLGVDFHIVNTVVVLDEPYAGQFTRQELTGAEIDTLLRERNNVATEIHLTLRVRK